MVLEDAVEVLLAAALISVLVEITLGAGALFNMALGGVAGEEDLASLFHDDSSLVDEFLGEAAEGAAAVAEAAANPW